MKNPSAPLHHQRGVAVITALLLTTLAITIVSSLFWQQQVQVRSIENQRLQLQKQWVLRGALDWAGLILREDAKNSSVDHLTEPWAVPLAETQLDQYVENGKIDGDVSDAALSGNIIDAQSRYNLRNLATNGTVNPVEVGIFQRLLTSLGIKPGLAQATADMIAAAQEKPRDPAAAANPAAQPEQRPMDFEQTDDLLAVPGFSVELLEKVKNFVVVLPNPTPINVNTAGVEVLAAKIDTLSLAEAAALVASRDHAYFKDASDFRTRLPGKAVQTEATGIDGKAVPAEVVGMDVSTSYFLVNGKVRLNRASLEVQALVFRPPFSGATKIIWIREN